MTETAPSTDVGRPLRLFFSAGDVSGDLHAANVIREIRRLRPDAVLEGLGGDRMQAAGCTIRHPLTGMNVMWLKNVLRHMGTIFRTQRDTLDHFTRHRPDAVVLVDFPGYNLRLARRLWKHRIPVIYYISPQIWAWHASRIHRIRRHVTKVLCILPFEEKIYRDAGVPVEFVGHPLFDHLDEVTLDEGFCRQLRAEAPGRLIGLLPGSRDQEIRALLPVMAMAAARVLHALPDTLFAVSCLDERRETIVREVLAKHPRLPVRVFRGRTFEVMKEADFCMVASGTATLELAHYNTPMTILYRVNPFA
ncbi:MAG TPA: lipid-A-disaccharide synthase, partial [Planctomycetota bacterium]|nr:lipid-A-disaccharide synthase [Planctomycetota bacterium]